MQVQTHIKDVTSKFSVIQSSEYWESVWLYAPSLQIEWYLWLSGSFHYVYIKLNEIKTRWQMQAETMWSKEVGFAKQYILSLLEKNGFSFFISSSVMVQISTTRSNIFLKEHKDFPAVVLSWWVKNTSLHWFIYMHSSTHKKYMYMDASFPFLTIQVYKQDQELQSSWNDHTICFCWIAYIIVVKANNFSLFAKKTFSHLFQISLILEPHMSRKFDQDISAHYSHSTKQTSTIRVSSLQRRRK